MSTVVPNVGFRTQAPLLWVTNSVSRTIAVHFASDYTDTLDIGVWIWYGPFWASTRVGALCVGARRPVATSILFRALVHIHALFERVPRVARLALTAEASQSVRADRVLAAASGGAIYRIAFVYINATSCNIVRIEGPPIFADAVGFVSIRFAVRVVPASNFVAGSFAWYMRRGTNETGFTVTMVAPSRICTDRRGSAGVR